MENRSGEQLQPLTTIPNLLPNEQQDPLTLIPLQTTPNLAPLNLANPTDQQILLNDRLIGGSRQVIGG